MAHSHHEHREHKAAKARVKHILGHKRGGAAHSDEKQDRKLFGKMMMKEHEGKVHGHKSGGRLDKRARGGGTKKGKHHTQVNIVVAPHHGGSPSPDVGGAPAGAGIGPPPLPPGGPMPPPPGAGAMPPPGGMPPGPMKRGGRAYKRGGGTGMTAGAESGPGRLEKAHKYKKHH